MRVRLLHGVLLVPVKDIFAKHFRHVMWKTNTSTNMHSCIQNLVVFPSWRMAESLFVRSCHSSRLAFRFRFVVNSVAFIA